ncbi:[DsrC]-trisulfide reductase DsrK [Desulfovibrio sp. OttesenSCG-928-O18]|nr:[DsrC]-trisulfide reductase DsrK [Desulfovibrio sp. OttesenSCG-928-O18]
MAKLPPSKDLAASSGGLFPGANLAGNGWMNTKPVFKPGSYCYPAKVDTMRGLGMPNPHEWAPEDKDWNLPDGWERILHEAFADRLKKYRSLKLFMDICVRCGACADKCHFFLGTGDPKNMPVLRAELLRSVYRKDFTTVGKLLGKVGGSRSLDPEVVKEWFYYFYQCTECRRCSIFCPYGIDTAEITMIARELLHEVGLGINWIMDPVSNCNRTGNHLGIQPHAFKEIVEFLCEDIEAVTGITINPPFNEKGHEVLFITPSGDVFADPGIYTFMGYLMLFHEIGLDYTLSTYASEGGNFGLFTSSEMMKKINGKMYAEAERLGAKWILGGECGHMWRVVHQYMDSMNGPTPKSMVTPVSPITGTVFDFAASTKMVHIAEFTADLIRHNKLNLDPSRNDHLTVTYHDSCNPARGMGLLDEPREVLKAVCNNFVEMPENTIREQTFCCGAGSGLNTDEIMELRMRAGMPRGNALRYVQANHGVNHMACICAIDRATLPPLADYWAPGVTVSGLHELVANALVMKGEQKRTMDMRQEDLPGIEDDADEAEESGGEEA